jgi:hypothetical protein
VPSPTPAGSAVLLGVAAVSARSAWAVGGAGTSPSTLILRWNGSVWRRAHSPTPASGAVLLGVAAASAGRAWAVGHTGSVGSIKTLILRWNGTAWK